MPNFIMAINLEKFYEIVSERMLELADYQREMCWKVENLGKDTQENVTSTDTHNALTYMDMFSQDYMMIFIFQKFPSLIPMIEESTGMKKKYQDNDSET